MVSLIVPTRNAEGTLSDLLSLIKKQTVIPDEIIIVDSSSTDNTVKIARQYGVKIISINKAEFDHGGTRSLAGREAQGDILVYMTQDVAPADDSAISRLIEPFLTDDHIGAVFGRQVPFDHASFFGAHLRSFNYPEESYVRMLDDRDVYGFKTVFLSNSFAAYRKDVLKSIGWLPDNVIMGEDTCAAAKILLKGLGIAYVAEARVYHSHNYSTSEDFRRYFDIGVFHRKERWLTEEFGRAEGEGRKYIKSELLSLLQQHKYYLIPESVLRSVLKYMGYKMGYHYRWLPKNIARSLSMHRAWWK